MFVNCFPVWYQKESSFDGSSSKLDALPAKVFRQKNNIVRVDFESNRLCSIDERLFSFPKLRELNFNCNQINCIPNEIGQLKCLEELSIGSNNLASIPESLFSCKLLKTLNFSRNPINQLPKELRNLENLEYLDITDTCAGNIPDVFDDLKNLRTLIFRENFVDELPESLLTLANLENLDAGCNELLQLPENFGGLQSLEQLHLDFNKLARIPNSFGMLKRLCILDISSNIISYLPDSLSKLENLVDLNLSCNHLDYLPEVFGNLKNLKILRVDKNMLSQLPESFGGLTSLVELHLSQNNLSMLPESFGALTNLQIVNLNHNQLTELPQTIGMCTNLSILILSNNHLATLPDSLQQMQNLRILDLKCNRLEYLPRGLIDLNLSALWLSYSQPEPLIDLQIDTNVSLGDFATCYLLPQDAGYNTLDRGSENYFEKNQMNLTSVQRKDVDDYFGWSKMNYNRDSSDDEDSPHSFEEGQRKVRFFGVDENNSNESSADDVSQPKKTSDPSPFTLKRRDTPKRREMQNLYNQMSKDVENSPDESPNPVFRQHPDFEFPSEDSSDSSHSSGDWPESDERNKNNIAARNWMQEARLSVGIHNKRGSSREFSKTDEPTTDSSSFDIFLQNQLLTVDGTSISYGNALKNLTVKPSVFDCWTLTLHRLNEDVEGVDGYGLQLAGSFDTPYHLFGNHQSSVVISNLTEQAAQMYQDFLRAGDRLISVENLALSGKDHAWASCFFVARDKVVVVVRRDPHPDSIRKINIEKVPNKKIGLSIRGSNPVQRLTNLLTKCSTKGSTSSKTEDDSCPNGGDLQFDYSFNFLFNPVLITKIYPDSMASRCELIESGMVIVEINDTLLVHSDKETAISCVPKSENFISIVLYKPSPCELTDGMDCDQ